MYQLFPHFLEGISILDFTRLLPGPLGTKMLAGYGAQVTKIELHEKSDWLKTAEPIKNGVSVYYEALNAEKTINTYHNQEAAMEALPYLIKNADILIEQFRPGVMDRLQLGYEACKAMNPSLIYVSLTGYGQTGAMRQRAGHDLNYMAESGLLSLNNTANLHRVGVPSVLWADIAGGTYPLVAACFAGLYQRSRTGKGCYLDLSISDNLQPFLFQAKADASAGVNPYTPRLLNGGVVNYQVYETRDNKWIAFGALEPKFWNLFCDLVAKPAWKTAQPAALSQKNFNIARLKRLFLKQDQCYWVQLGLQHDICLSPVNMIA